MTAGLRVGLARVSLVGASLVRAGLGLAALAVLGAAAAYWLVRGEALLLDLSFIGCF